MNDTYIDSSISIPFVSRSKKEACFRRWSRRRSLETFEIICCIMSFVALVNFPWALHFVLWTKVLLLPGGCTAIGIKNVNSFSSPISYYIMSISRFPLLFKYSSYSSLVFVVCWLMMVLLLSHDFWFTYVRIIYFEKTRVSLRQFIVIVVHHWSSRRGYREWKIMINLIIHNRVPTLINGKDCFGWLVTGDGASSKFP